MNTNKTFLRSALFFSLAVIWFFVFRGLWKVFAVKEEQPLIAITPHVSFNIDSIQKKDFKLSRLQRDPFRDFNVRNSISKSKVVVRGTKVSKPKITKSVKHKATKHMEWPNLSYFGFVKSSTKKSKLVLLKVNSNFMRVREKSMIDSKISIVSIYKDSIRLKRNNEFKTILRQ